MCLQSEKKKADLCVHCLDLIYRKRGVKDAFMSFEAILISLVTYLL